VEPKRLPIGFSGENAELTGQFSEARPDQLESQLDGRLPSLLLVGGPHGCALVIAEQRHIPGPGNVALGELRWGPHIHHRAQPLKKPIDGLRVPFHPNHQ
jgi:hypothetical protein